MVLFTSVRPLERAENLKTVYDAFDGEKEYVQTVPGQPIPDLHSGKYTLQVGDELPTETCGKFIWIGHGMGAGKAYGIQRKWFHHTELIDYAIASSNEMVPYVSMFTGLNKSQIVPLGMPRTDAYFKKQKSTHYRKQYLYVPTFRAYDWWKPDWSSLERCLNEDELFIVKPHMVTKRLLPKGKHWDSIIERSSEIPSTDSLVDSDVVITDYSSIMFDAFVLRKPVVLFAKDRFKYLRQRPMYCQYPEMYSDYFCDYEDALVNVMRQARWTPHLEELRGFYAGACDGHSTERCIELIRSML